MNGTIAQMIALVAYGNYYLTGKSLPDDFYPSNSTFKFCNEVDFREVKKRFFWNKPQETVVAGNPTGWFKQLKRNGCKKLRLYYQSSSNQSAIKDYQSAGFIGGGGTWLMEAVYHNCSDAWASRWQVTRQNDPESKIWTVNYGLAGKDWPTINQQTENISSIKEKLEQLLVTVANFAFQHDLENWGHFFERAKARLSSEEPHQAFYHTDLIPAENYSLEARQLLFGAGAAWAFGGMGSWNDIGFDNQHDNDEYQRLSQQLYGSIIEGFIAAVNAY